jgi:hypothetical protein
VVKVFRRDELGPLITVLRRTIGIIQPLVHRAIDFLFTKSANDSVTVSQLIHLKDSVEFEGTAHFFPHSFVVQWRSADGDHITGHVIWFCEAHGPQHHQET